MIPGEVLIQIKKEILNKIYALPVNAQFRLVEFLNIYELESDVELQVSIDLLSELINFGYCDKLDIKMDVSNLPKNMFLIKIK